MNNTLPVVVDPSPPLSNMDSNHSSNSFTTNMSTSESKTSGPSVFLYKGKKVEIKDIWASNLEEGMAMVRDLVRTHPYVAMVSFILILSLV